MLGAAQMLRPSDEQIRDAVLKLERRIAENAAA